MIDGHCHLDEKIGPCEEAMKSLNKEAVESGVTRIILLNLPEQGFDSGSVIKHAKDYNGVFKVFPSLRPTAPNALEELESLRNLGAAGLKLHPRLHDYLIDSDECVRLVQKAGQLDMPVVVDCFPDGKNLFLGNTPDRFARLAEKAPNARIAIGHAGGHRIFDALMVAKYFKNIYLDLSYTLLYYRNSTVMEDIAYAIISIKAERIFWGSDYPDRPYAETVELSLQELSRMNLPEKIKALIINENVEVFLGERIEF